MKKLVYVFVAFAAISFASCGNKTANTEAAAADSCAVVACDSAKACCDSAKVACDSVKCDSACVK